jgi:hypothetical protein
LQRSVQRIHQNWVHDPIHNLEMILLQVVQTLPSRIPATAPGLIRELDQPVCGFSQGRNYHHGPARMFLLDHASHPSNCVGRFQGGAAELHYDHLKNRLSLSPYGLSRKEGIKTR